MIFQNNPKNCLGWTSTHIGTVVKKKTQNLLALPTTTKAKDIVFRV